MIGRQRAHIAELEARIAELERRLGKNPRNSSLPPSAEGLAKPPVPNRAERRAAKKRPGKQPGADGHHLAQVEHPDEVVCHRPERCFACAGDLAGADVVDVEVRQVFDVPRTTAYVTEHRMERLRCSCGAKTKAAPPPVATAPACYGPSVRALAVYLSVYQHVPYERLAEIFSDLLGVSISVGTITAMVRAAGLSLGHFRSVVTDRLAEARAVHFDETGARAEGRLHWVHVAATSRYTLLACHERRGSAAIDDLGVMAQMTGVAVHDGFKPYRSYDVVHALCNAHHLRELEGITEHFGQDWAKELIDLLLWANGAVEAAVADGQSELDQATLASIRARYEDLIASGRAANAGGRTTPVGKWYANDARNLLRRLDRHRDDVLRFTADFDVGFTNNQAERDIRMVKLQQKISGSWRTKAGADDFCAIRSYISTMKKHGQDVLDGLRGLFQGRCWLPGGT